MFVAAPALALAAAAVRLATPVCQIATRTREKRTQDKSQSEPHHSPVYLKLSVPVKNVGLSDFRGLALKGIHSLKNGVTRRIIEKALFRVWIYRAQLLTS